MKLQIEQLQQRIQATVATVRSRAHQQGVALRAVGKRPEATVRRVLASGRTSFDGLVQSADHAKKRIDQHLGTINTTIAKVAQHPLVQKLAASPIGTKIVVRLPGFVSQLLTPAASEPTIES